MGLDIRLPIGFLFSIFGVLLIVFGELSDKAIYERSLGHQHQPGVGNCHAAVRRGHALPGQAWNQGLNQSAETFIFLINQEHPMENVRSFQRLKFAIWLAVAAIVLLTTKLRAETPPPPPIMLGTAWYPEQWPESRWDADLTLMQQAGIHMVRVGEFAWSRMEPSEGQYDLDWLDRAVTQPRSTASIPWLAPPLRPRRRG